jgi:hypothetical protein
MLFLFSDFLSFLPKPGVSAGVTGEDAAILVFRCSTTTMTMR